MIDIVFLLIIFFMVSSRFTQLNQPERDISIQVPAVSDGTALTQAPRNRVINVFENGSVTLDDQTVTIEELETQLAGAKAQYKKLGVVVRGDANCSYQKVASVIATCRKVDIRNLNISVQDSTMIR
jgi:biopolymer transport protein ExbD